MAGPWRRFVVRPLVWFVTLLVAVAAGALLLVRSELVRHRLAAFAETRIGEAIGREVAIGRLDFTLLPFAIVLEQVEIASDRPGLPPFAAARRVEIDGDWHGTGRRSLELARVAIDGLALHLEFRADGSDNVPRPVASSAGGGGFELRLGGLYVENGSVTLDEATAPFALAAEGVAVRATGLARVGLDASVSTQRLELRLPEAQPLDVSFSARARLAGDRLEIVQARIGAPDLAIVARGEVGFARPTTVALETTVRSSGALLDRLGWLKGEIDGDFVFDGEFGWRERSWSARGKVASPALAVVGFELAELAGTVDASARGATLEVERARYADGALAGRFQVALRKPYRATVELDATEVAVQRVLDQFELPIARLPGRASGPFRYEFDLLDADAGDGSGTFVLAGEPEGAVVDGTVALELGGGELRLTTIDWRRGGASIAGNGSVALAGGDGRFDLAVESDELALLLPHLTFLPTGELWLPTTGSVRAEVALAIGGGATTATVALEGGGLEAPGFRAEQLTGVVRVTPNEVVLERMALERPGARLDLAGHLPIAAGGRELELRLAAELWPLDEAWRWLPARLPIAGSVSGSLSLAGALDALRGEADLVVLRPEIAGVDARRLEAKLRFDPEVTRLERGRIELDAGVVELSGALTSAGERLDFSWRGDALALDRAPFDILGGGRLRGRLALSGQLGGSLERPELTLDGELTSLALGERELGLADGAGVAAPSTLRARWADGRLEARLTLAGLLEIEGGGRLEPDGAGALVFEATSAHLDRLAQWATGAPVAELEGTLGARLAVDWPQGGTPSVAIELPRAAFTWRGSRFEALEPVRARFDGGRLIVDSVYLGWNDGNDELFVGGTIELSDDPKLDLHLQADVGAEIVRPFIGDLALGGRLSVLADVGGTATAPELNGQGEWSAGRYVPDFLPHQFEDGRALVLFYPDALVLDRLTGRFASGELEASGRVELGQGTATGYRFEVAARHLALRWPPGWQTRGDAELTLASTPAGRQLSGIARFDRLFYFQEIDLSPGQLAQRLLARSRVVVPETDELLATTSLNVALVADESVRIRNDTADLTASAELVLRGSLARPVLFGDVRASPGGRVTYSGNRYEIERGLLHFVDSTRIDPQLDIVARTKVDEYDVALVVAGPLSRPLASFTSDPPLADLEIFGLLTSGSVPTGALLADRTATSATTAVGAESLIYGQAASLVGARVGRLFGFDQVRVEPLTTGDAVSAARVTVGKRLSRNLFVTYSLDPTSTAQEILQAEWRLSDGLVLILTQNGNESFSIDARWESRF